MRWRMSSDRLAEIAGRLSLREDGAGRSSSSPVRSQPSPDEHAGAAGAGPGGVGGGRGGGGGGEAASSNSGRESRTPSDVTGITPEKLGPNDFLFGEELGQGSYSSVKRATMKRSGKAAAIKVVEKALVIKEKKTQYMVMERDCLTLCIHPGVIRLNATFQVVVLRRSNHSLVPLSLASLLLAPHSPFSPHTFHAAAGHDEHPPTMLRALTTKQGWVRDVTRVPLAGCQLPLLCHGRLPA